MPELNQDNSIVQELQHDFLSIRGRLSHIEVNNILVKLRVFLSGKHILRSTIVLITCLFLLNCMVTTANAVGEDPEDPKNLLPRIEQDWPKKGSLFPVSPLKWLHNGTTKANQALYDATSIKLGLTLTHLFQGLSNSLPGEPRLGTATTLDFLGSWDLLNKGKPTNGQFFFGVQGRWDYGATSPQDLGALSLGSLIGTANTFLAYHPAFLLRNLFWDQGSPEAGWAYRFGKITPDAILSSSSHISAQTSFISTASTGPFAIALPDSGLGAVGAWYINDRLALIGLVSDANAERHDFGDITAGDFFKAVEFAFKIFPRTPKAGYSRLTLWHTDGTKNGLSINGNTGRDGSGFFVKIEQELNADGRAIGIVRYGKSFNDSAVYEQLATAQFLFYNPPDPARITEDLFGAAINWGQSSQKGTRNEYDLEFFYKFPLFPLVEVTFLYQLIVNPAFTRELDNASVLSLRLRTTF